MTLLLRPLIALLAPAILAASLGWVQPDSKPAKPKAAKHKSSEGKSSASSQDEMKKSVNASTARVKLPRDVQDALAAFVGKFDSAVEVRLAPPPAPPLKSREVTTGKWIMGGLFLRVTSSAPDDEELKTERLTIYGYDPQAKKYTLWQIEAGSLTPTTATGDYDADTSTFTFESKRAMPAHGNATLTSVIRAQKDGTLTKTLTMKMPNGKSSELAKVTHTRKSKG